MKVERMSRQLTKDNLKRGIILLVEFIVGFLFLYVIVIIISTILLGIVLLIYEAKLFDPQLWVTLAVFEFPLTALLSFLAGRGIFINPIDKADSLRKYGHLQLYYLSRESKEKKHVVWNRKGRCAYYAPDYIILLSRTGIVRTERKFKKIVDLQTQFEKEGILLTQGVPYGTQLD
jgi:hypothetical protein